MSKKQPESESATAEEEAALNNGQDEQDASESDTASDEALSPEQILEKLEATREAADKAKDDLLRVQAEMQNLRRRTEQDVERAHKYALERFSSELLQVVDNLERAAAAAGDSKDPAVKAIQEGVELTLKSLIDCFDKFNIATVDPLGEPFDPELHQAMSMQENPDVEPDTVTAVVQKGYTLNGRVIRPAMVMVSKAPSD